MKTIAILVAAGSAARMQHRDKLLLHIGGRSVLRRCADQFEACDGIDGIVVVARQDRCARVEAELAGLYLCQFNTYLCSEINDILIENRKLN